MIYCAYTFLKKYEKIEAYRRDKTAQRIVYSIYSTRLNASPRILDCGTMNEIMHPMDVTVLQLFKKLN